MSLVSIDKISAGYGKENVIEDISLKINSGELVGILGLNGSGKSTLAKAICNIMPHTGSVVVNEKEIEKMSISKVSNIISYIPQQSGLGIDISVFDVVMMGFNSRLKMLERPSNAMKERAIHILDIVGLKEHANDNYMLLSEGQKRLVIIARALVNEGNIIIMDEPEGALDFSVRYKMMKLIRQWIGEGDRAGIAILHDTMLALNNCDKLVLINDGRIVGIIDSSNDTIESMADKLSIIYGDISLTRVKDTAGKDSIVMVCNSEEV